MRDNAEKMDVMLGDIKYRVGIDANGCYFAETYNEKYEIWVHLQFSSVGVAEAVESALSILKQDYFEKSLPKSPNLLI